MSEPSDNNVSDALSPIQGKPRREGNDSLWKRARRTLGTNSLTFLQPQNKPSGMDLPTLLWCISSTDLNDSTHRQRTQNYIKALESEVIRLRGSEGDLMQQNNKLQNQVDALLSAITKANVPLPAGFQPPAKVTQPINFDYSMPTTISYKTDDLNNPRLHLDWPALSGVQPFQTDREGSVSPHEQFAKQSNINNIKPLPNLPQDFSLTSLSFNPTYEIPPLLTAQASMDRAEVAIDFVLALEHPCMTHLPHPANPPSEDPSNHALLMSTPLLSRAPRPPEPNSSWTANSSILQQLLNLSSSINLDGEITPVEAWHQLRQHRRFLTLDKNSIERIKADLSTIVHCCGFGAVMDEAAFHFTLEATLGPA
ncbi:MAG: hypothetical protein Q9212_000795 [Teloschistes hypoglaucus]